MFSRHMEKQQGGQRQALNKQRVLLPTGCEESNELQANLAWCGGTKHIGCSNTATAWPGN